MLNHINMMEGHSTKMVDANHKFQFKKENDKFQ